MESSKSKEVRRYKLLYRFCANHSTHTSSVAARQRRLFRRGPDKCHPMQISWLLHDHRPLSGAGTPYLPTPLTKSVNQHTDHGRWGGRKKTSTNVMLVVVASPIRLAPGLSSVVLVFGCWYESLGEKTLPAQFLGFHKVVLELHG